MRHRRRRWWGLVAVAIGAVVAAAAAAIAAAVGDSERVAATWVSAVLAPDGTATVTEVIDYDFGVSARRGIFRDVPGLSPEARVTVSSPTAPDDLTMLPIAGGARIRIGDPDRTVTGRHRYTITYPLSSLVRDGRLAWNAVGTEWTVPIQRSDVHVTGPWRFDDLRCDEGRAGDVGGCRLDEPEAGRLTASIGSLSPGEGVTVRALLGAPLAAAPAAPAAPSGPVDDPGTSPWWPGLVALAAAAVVAVPVRLGVRRAGRERVAAGGPVAAAFGVGDGSSTVSLDLDDLAAMATVEFAPPPGLTAWQGGLVLDEQMRHEHQVAWLLEAVARRWIAVDATGTPALRPGEEWPDPDSASLVEGLLAGRSSVPLGSYDATFAKGWRALGERLDGWLDASGLWEPAGERRRGWALGLGLLGVVVGLGLTILGGVLAARWGPVWLLAVAAGGGLVGAAVAALVGRWELRVRSAAGSALWLRTESFRRFLAASEGRHVDEAARRHQVLEYTAWAVALGEADRWARAVSESSVASHDPSLVTAAYASTLVSSTRTASVAPSSSGGGGGGGGGVGGGGGGGGGGSW